MATTPSGYGVGSNPMNTYMDQYLNWHAQPWGGYKHTLPSMGIPQRPDPALLDSATQLEIARINADASQANTLAQMPTAAQLALAYRGFQPVNQYYRDNMQSGGYTPESRQAILSAAYGNVNNSATAMQRTMNDQLAQRGLGGNPYAQQAVGMQGQFAAAGARGQALAGIEQNAIQNRMTAAQGLSGTAAAQGALAMKPLADPGNLTQYSDSGFTDQPQRRNPYESTMGRPGYSNPKGKPRYSGPKTFGG